MKLFDMLIEQEKAEKKEQADKKVIRNAMNTKEGISQIAKILVQLRKEGRLEFTNE